MCWKSKNSYKLTIKSSCVTALKGSIHCRASGSASWVLSRQYSWRQETCSKLSAYLRSKLYLVFFASFNSLMKIFYAHKSWMNFQASQIEIDLWNKSYLLLLRTISLAKMHTSSSSIRWINLNLDSQPEVATTCLHKSSTKQIRSNSKTVSRVSWN